MSTATEPTIIERKDIHEAAKLGLPKLVAKLADSGVDINGLDAAGKTALMVAAEFGHLAIVRLLFERGANIDHQKKSLFFDEIGNSALMVAAQHSNLEVVHGLIEMGANLELIDGWGQTALHLATDQAQAQELETVRLLIAKGANIDHVGKWGWTPVLVAAQNDNPEMVRLLIASGANLDLAGEDGTPLDVAIASRHQGVIDVIDAFERRRVARNKRHVRSVARQIGLPEDVEGVIGSLLKSNA